MMQSCPTRSVPQKRSIRVKIQEAAVQQVRESRWIPPVPLETLQVLARQLLQGLQLDLSFLNYTMVMISNKLWEDYIAHIPCRQRLLLLPICLRNQSSCQASYDELGLICRECGSCLIPEITRRAENLGMNVLVAESSSMVSQWVETGEVRTVIGVSCLHSLEKTFPSLMKNGVPGMAVPLNYDGCRDTEFDEPDLDQILSIPEKSVIHDLSRADLNQYIGSLFSRDRLDSFIQAETPYLSRFRDGVMHSLCDNGKHYRPMIVAGTYCALTEEDSVPDLLDPIMIAVECFHKASLIHDDIEDEDDMRYGEPTFHKKEGIPAALNTGDFLLGEGYRLLSLDSIPKELRADLYAQAAQAHCELSLGQAQEFESLQGEISLERILSNHRLKTAPAFRISLAMAAIAAGRFEEFQAVFASFSDALGTAYQLKDDLEDSEPNPASTVDCLMKMEGLDRNAARCRVEALLEEFTHQAYEELEEITEPLLKIFLYRLIGKVLDR